MSALHIPKEIKPELDVFAFQERERTGFEYLFTSAKLARNIFVWGFEQYRKAGNLARLKSARLVFPDEPISDDQLWDRIGARGEK
jgi:hypothetical protein